MKKIFHSLAVLSIILFTIPATAQITLTTIYDVYNSSEEVQFVLDKGQIDGRIVQFLLDDNQPSDQKAAIMNALTSNNSTQSNALTFKQFVARKYGENWQQLNTSKLTANELFCFGYLTILDEEGTIENGLPLLEEAIAKDPSDYTIQLITALASAQKSVENRNKCEAWLKVESVVNNSSLNKNMNTAMETALLNAVKPFQSACN
jgi:hypothetical protein